MSEYLSIAREFLSGIHPVLVPVAGVFVLLLLAWLADVIARRRLLAIVHRLAARTRTTWDDVIVEHRVITRAVHVIPAAVIYFGLPLIPELGDTAVRVMRNVVFAYAVIMLVAAFSGALGAANTLYETREDSDRRPIKGYIQVAKIILWCLGLILVVSILLDKSPLILLSGFGALTAILLLVFKDTILSLVASVQLSSLDMVRVGDWIEMPKFNADGDVIDVALHTIRVQNWDKTITTIPTHRLISDSFRNWRGMSESGGRRIKRCLMIDMASVRFLTPDEVAHFSRFALLRDYIEAKQKELADYNAALDVPADCDVNLRRLSNLGTFRAYVSKYLENHPALHKDMTLLVRQLQPQPEGMPIEIYCFTRTTNWDEYESIQGDIFDHLLAILDEFGLRAYQRPGGADLVSRVAEAPESG